TYDGSINIFLNSFGDDVYFDVVNAFGKIVNSGKISEQITSTGLPSNGIYWIVIHSNSGARLSEKVVY
ncbi:MAG: hypothetical protein ACHQFW_06855, partial [Chitinophagales bacterium]